MFKGIESGAMFMYDSSVTGTQAKSKTPNQRYAGRGGAGHCGYHSNKHVAQRTPEA